jgi:hypothetical protein
VLFGEQLMSDEKDPVLRVCDAIGSQLLNVFACATGYRFRLYLNPLGIPDTVSFDVNELKELKEKARASATVSGIFLAFSAAFLVAVLGKDFACALNIFDPIALDPCKWNGLTVFQTGVLTLAGIVLPVLPLLGERWVSAAKWDARKTSKDDKHLRAQRYVLLAIWILILVAGALFVSFCLSEVKFGASFAFSGVALIFVSLLLLVLSVEFYDTAGGWQSSSKEYYFHMASIASHCYVLGLSTGVVGISLLICLNHVTAGCWLVVIAVIALTAMTEIERTLKPDSALH